ncbi:MAG: lamin tail domain-containing protein [Phycisphaerae bacterium]|nr:lamin tail domain-containing protein [Phycisphaerae bacterium]
MNPAMLLALTAFLAEPPKHPVITEVLYAVPTAEGDANADGTRDAVGDEFVEIANTTDAPIQLRGYRLSDRNDASPDRKGGWSFVFPELELKPGEVAVVFNGHGAKWSGPVGDTSRAPEGRNEKFHRAWVFTSRNDSDRVGFNNTGDWVMLSSPDNKPLECVLWGNAEKGEPKAVAPKLSKITEQVRDASVQRRAASEDFVSHRKLAPPRDKPARGEPVAKEVSVPFSPGYFESSGGATPADVSRPGTTTDPKPESTPAEKPRDPKPSDAKPKPKGG